MHIVAGFAVYSDRTPCTYKCDSLFEGTTNVLEYIVLQLLFDADPSQVYTMFQLFCALYYKFVTPKFCQKFYVAQILP